ATGPRQAASYDIQRCGNTSNRVLLTFDDWSYDNSKRAVQVGEYLQGKGIRAAFFLINEYASQYPGTVETLRRQGHYVGNHTWSHPHLPQLSDQEVRTEITKGVASTLLRPPYGDFGERETRIAAELGYRMCTWTIDTLDWDGPGGSRTASQIRAAVTDASAADKRGGVVLGHLFTRYPDVLPDIIGDLRGQGYAFCRDTGATTRNIPAVLKC
ncbi:polysaccharide deacetylase family protein, partial [Streptomyces sp. UNOC14_S4]|uniref:polysaccharide deacetylase family protein n=1 Tax=Streptomyces sp. UNOC14_S4 TaxID=2872340 RepID=UPI001E4CE5D8